MTTAKIIGIMILSAGIIVGCSKSATRQSAIRPPNDSTANDTSKVDLYDGVPQSDIYEVTATQNNESKRLVVFQSTCPDYRAGYMDMTANDAYPLSIFKGRSISWANFSMTGSVTIKVKVTNILKVPLIGNIKVFPSKYNIVPTVSGNEISFTITQPGQFSLEIGDNGYRNGLMLFVNPPESDIPDTSLGKMIVFNHDSKQTTGVASGKYSGIYFKKGIHDIGVFHVPLNIKNIYLEDGAWVYGSLILDGNPDVKIYGRGVLSSAKLNYRQSHCIEAINHSDNIDLEGIVIADQKFFAVRLIGKNNIVKWVKTIGGWTYNCDGIAAFEGSQVSHCFIWANDDNLKVYRNNISFSDCVCWQLNNGGIIQLSWGNGNATDVTIRNIDILHAEWNKDEVNRGIVSCVGDKFAKGGMHGLQQNFLIEGVTTETSVPLIFRISPNPASPDEIHGMVFKNWNVKMDMMTGFSNHIIGSDPVRPFDGLVFENFILNGIQLTFSNWTATGNFQVKNIQPPVFQ